VQLTGDAPPLFLNRCRGSRAPEANFAVSFVFQSLFKSTPLADDTGAPK